MCEGYAKQLNPGFLPRIIVLNDHIVTYLTDTMLDASGESQDNGSIVNCTRSPPTSPIHLSMYDSFFSPPSPPSFRIRLTPRTSQQFPHPSPAQP